jgi:glycine dehydrogenase subunit 2
MARAYTYIRHLGAEGLKRVSENAVVNANYLKELLKEKFELPHDRICMHEFVLSGSRQKKRGARTADIAKRLLDFGFHAPTIYFPLIISEALMIEPTETEAKESLDSFAEALLQIDREIDENLDLVLSAPHDTPVRRLDEVQATKTLDISYNG